MEKEFSSITGRTGSSGLLVSSLGPESSTMLLAQHLLSPESLQRHWVKWIICVAPGVEVNPESVVS